MFCFQGKTQLATFDSITMSYVSDLGYTCKDEISIMKSQTSSDNFY